MKFEWSPEKNERLKEERNISFEEVVFHLSQGDLWRITDHPDQARYPGQSIYFVIVNEYVFLVPHVPGADVIFLKTIIPSRKATKLYRAEREA